MWSGSLDGVSDYADFYVLVATLSTAFLAAGLLVDYRLALQEPTRFLRIVALAGLGLNVLLTVVTLFACLSALADFREEHDVLRGMLIASVLLQFLLSAGYPVVEARREGRRRRAAAAALTTEHGELPEEQTGQLRS